MKSFVLQLMGMVLIIPIFVYFLPAPEGASFFKEIISVLLLINCYRILTQSWDELPSKAKHHIFSKK